MCSSPSNHHSEPTNRPCDSPQPPIAAVMGPYGDRVLFGKWSGTEVKLDGDELLIMKESDIMGVLDESSAAHAKAA